MIKIAIVDADVVACEYTHNIVMNYFFMKGWEYRTFLFHLSRELLSHIYESFDLILLEINMPDISGLKIAELLRKQNLSSTIIFISNQIQLMQNAFGRNVFSFLSKKKLEICLPKILEKCLDELKLNALLCYKTNDGLITLQQKEVLYADMVNRKVALHTVQSNFILNIWTLDKFYKTIQSFGNFIYVNRSTIVNLSYITKIAQDYTLILKGKKTPIIISKDKYKDVCSTYTQWLSKLYLD